ncbi:hypothetical protein PVAP13_9KG384583 [Panicum virgatum]|uniref:Uncharacterized protein n=1 Tax=Panicum virgatum TaxID=38727 RepID=A0A8T0N7B1_PANVG|nr:hypothetical protein PVAP13_9KG384583 [Panicum virgatum]
MSHASGAPCSAAGGVWRQGSRAEADAGGGRRGRRAAAGGRCRGHGSLCRVRLRQSDRRPGASRTGVQRAGQLRGGQGSRVLGATAVRGWRWARGGAVSRGFARAASAGCSIFYRRARGVRKEERECSERSICRRADAQGSSWSSPIPNGRPYVSHPCVIA